MSKKFISPVQLSNSEKDVKDNPDKVYTAARLFVDTFKDKEWYDESAVDAARANVLPYMMKNGNKRKQIPAAWFAVLLAADRFDEYWVVGGDIEDNETVSIDMLEGIAGPFSSEDAALDAIDCIEEKETSVIDKIFDAVNTAITDITGDENNVKLEKPETENQETAFDSKDLKLEVIDCEGGNASVCVIIGKEMREDPQHADIPKAEAEAALEAYKKGDDPIAKIALRSVDRWPLVGEISYEEIF